MSDAPFVGWWLVVALVALSVVDAWSSWVLLGRGRVESSPLARILIARLGLIGAVFVRVLLGCTIAWVLARCIQLRPVRSTLVIVELTALSITVWWGLVCVNNIQLLANT